MSTETVFRTCNLCEATCGLEIEVVDGAVKRIRGDRLDVFSHGFICPKGSTLKQLHEDPDRLRAPMVRRDGELVEASWDEAWAAVAEGLGTWLEGERNGIGVYLGNPNVHNLGAGLYGRVLLKALGTRQIYSASTLDQMPRHVSSGLVFGDPGAMAVPDIDRTDYLLMLGANPVASNGSLATAPDWPGRIEAIRERGGRVVLVDPRRSETAEIVDEHVRIRPGADAAWLAAVATTIWDEGLDVESRALGHADGVGEVRTALAPFTAEAVEAVTGVDPGTTRRVAREVASAQSAAVYGRIGVHTVEFGTLASWLGDVVNLITGNLDEPGGMMWALPAHGAAPQAVGGGRGWTIGRWANERSGRPEVLGEYPASDLAEEILAGGGAVEALITIGGNPARSCPDTDLLEKALESVSFMVSVDIYLNETTRHADVILPVPSALEKSHYDIAFYGIAVRNIANWSPPVFETDMPSDAEVLCRFAELCAGLGPESDWLDMADLALDLLLSSAVRNEASPAFDRDPDELRELLAGDTPEDRMLDAMLRCGPYGDGFGADPDGLGLEVLKAHPHGVDLGPLQPRLPGVVRTASGRIELAPAVLLSDLDRLRASLDAPSSPLVLVGRRHVRSNNSWMHNVEVLMKGRSNRCTLQVHPDDASRLGLDDGGAAIVRSAAGEVTAPVEVSDVVMPGVVSLPHGWGHDAPDTRLSVASARPGVNSNALSDGSRIDAVSGNAVLNGIPVTLEPVDAAT